MRNASLSHISNEREKVKKIISSPAVKGHITLASVRVRTILLTLRHQFFVKLKLARVKLKIQKPNTVSITNQIVNGCMYTAYKIL